ncbi:B3 domain-containing transcription factor [Salix suchowensis]|nr:B3 domain-containing transcription factor [Salix suchowensis]
MTTCSKILSKTDTSKALSVPTKYLKSLPSFKGGHAVSFQAMDESGFVWTFKCSTRKKGHPKPVLSKGWLAFVRNKKLKVGDKIKFSVLDPTAGVRFYRVQAEKEVKIFGAIFGYSPITAP